MSENSLATTPTLFSCTILSKSPTPEFTTHGIPEAKASPNLVGALPSFEKLEIKSENIEWPEVDQKYLKEETFNIVTQINGKKRKVFSISKSLDKETLIKNIKNDDQIKKYVDNKEIIKTIYIENKLINFIIQ